MANNYTWASFTVPVKDADLTRGRMEALHSWLAGDSQTLSEALFGDKAAAIAVELGVLREESGSLGFDWDVDDDTLGLFHNETIDMEAAVLVAQILLDLDNNDAICTAEWADTCSKPRIGEFGGGAVAFTRDRTEWGHTGTLSQELAARLTTPAIEADADRNWQNNAIQFPRLLAEIAAVIELTDEQTAALSASMDLDGAQLSELFNRATETWDAIKDRTGR